MREAGDLAHGRRGTAIVLPGSPLVGKSPASFRGYAEVTYLAEFRGGTDRTPSPRGLRSYLFAGGTPQQHGALPRTRNEPNPLGAYAFESRGYVHPYTLVYNKSLPNQPFNALSSALCKHPYTTVYRPFYVRKPSRPGSGKALVTHPSTPLSSYVRQARMRELAPVPVDFGPHRRTLGGLRRRWFPRLRAPQRARSSLSW
jgi:hypothetical protein